MNKAQQSQILNDLKIPLQIHDLFEQKVGHLDLLEKEKKKEFAGIKNAYLIEIINELELRLLNNADRELVNCYEQLNQRLEELNFISNKDSLEGFSLDQDYYVEIEEFRRIYGNANTNENELNLMPEMKKELEANFQSLVSSRDERIVISDYFGQELGRENSSEAELF